MDRQAIFIREEFMGFETLLNAREVAHMLGLSVATIRKWVLIRYIPYQKVGRAVRFSALEIQEWIKSRSVIPLENRQRAGSSAEISGGEQL